MSMACLSYGILESVFINTRFRCEKHEGIKKYRELYFLYCIWNMMMVYSNIVRSQPPVCL